MAAASGTTCSGTTSSPTPRRRTGRSWRARRSGPCGAPTLRLPPSRGKSALGDAEGEPAVDGETRAGAPSAAREVDGPLRYLLRGAVSAERMGRRQRLKALEIFL